MRNLLVNGVFDEQTLLSLFKQGVDGIGFDLRGFSPHLITFKVLKDLLRRHHIEKKVLIFEQDKAEVILAALDLLKDVGTDFMLEMRDQRAVEFYQGLGRDFYWMFHPSSDWQKILELENLKGILLPLNWQQEYKKFPLLWQKIEDRHIEVFLHANTFAEAMQLKNNKEVNLSLDLSAEVISGPRMVNQDRLKNHAFWR